MTKLNMNMQSIINELWTEKSRSASKGSGMCIAMIKLLAKHLPQHVLQSNLLIKGKRSNLFLQTLLVNGTNLVGDNLTFSPIYSTRYPIGITVDSRCDRNDNDCSKILVQLTWTDYHTRPNLLHLCADRRIKVNLVNFKLLYHFQSSILSSSKMSAVTIWSSPCLCAWRAAVAYPFRGATLAFGASVNTIRLIERKAVRAFCMAISLSNMGLSSRSSSARSCIAVIIVMFINYAAKLLN